MTNTLGVYNPIFYAQEALIWLKKALGMANAVHMGFDAERKAKNQGQTISIRRPSVFTAQSAPSTAQDLATESVDISLSSWQEVKFALTDQEMAYTGDRIIQDHIMPAAYALADKIDQDGAALYKDIPWTLDSTIANGTSGMSVADVAAAWRTLFNNQAPMNNPNDLFFMVGGVEKEALMQIAAFSQWQGAGDMGVNTQVTGQLGRRFGFNFFENQNRPTHTAGVSADASGTLVGAHSKGATSISATAFTAAGTLKKGDTLVIAGSTQRYAVTGDITLDGSGASTAIGITPALVKAYSNNDVVTLDLQTSKSTHVNQNLAFNRNAFALAFAPLPGYEQFNGRLGVDVASIQDPVTGLAIRSRIYAIGTSSKIEVALDVLYGWKTLNPNLAMRLRAE